MLIAAVSVGRVYLGVHYVADVLAGVLLGVLLIWAFQALWPRLRGWLAERSFGFFVGAGLFAIVAVGAGLFLLGPRSHFMYNAAAIAVGGIIAFLIEYRAVHFHPGDPDWARTFSKVSIGLLGLIPLLVVDRMTGEDALWLDAALAFLGALWAFLCLPALFRWWRWGGAPLDNRTVCIRLRYRSRCSARPAPRGRGGRIKTSSSNLHRSLTKKTVFAGPHLFHRVDRCREGHAHANLVAS